MKKANKINDAILKDIVKQIVHISDPDKIILFGSRATGKAKKDSDYDVCVLKKNIKNKSSFLGNIYLNLSAGAPVDVIATTTKKFEELKTKWYYVYYQVAKEGRVVYEK